MLVYGIFVVVIYCALYIYFLIFKFLFVSFLVIIPVVLSLPFCHQCVLSEFRALPSYGRSCHYTWEGLIHH